MEMERLTWLDECFVQKLLQKAENDASIQVSGITVRPATAKGDNYSSDMHRVSVELSRIHNGHKITDTRSVIVKVAPEGSASAWSEMVSNSGIFEKEISMMTETLPKMDEMLAKLNMTSLAARCLQFQSEDPVYLIIEDLSRRGFRMAERRAGLDLDHSLLAIRNIAAFHAASVALAEKDPKITTYVPIHKNEKHGKDTWAVLNAFITGSTKALGEEVANWPELSPRIAEKILKISEIVWTKECEASARLPDDFNVLNHADCSLSNMLFRYDEQQKPIEQIFVDFQLSYYGSPAKDILFFLGSSPAVDVRMNDRELLLREYHNSLTTIMAKLKCNTKPPSFDDLQDILKKRAFYEVMPSFTALAHALVDRSEVNSFNALILSDDKPDHPAYRSKMYRKTMTRVLPFFDSIGLLDVQF